MQIAICDDEKMARDKIMALIKRKAPEENILVFDSGRAMLESNLEFDMIFLDIKMASCSGLEVAQQIRDKQEKEGKEKSLIIFVTGYREYMEQAFDVNAYHYLVKPIEEEKFFRVFERAYKERQTMQRQEERFILVKTQNCKQKVWLKEIFYVESSNKKVIFHLKNGQIESYGKMEEMEKLLGDLFFRCHRCYLVNMEKIAGYTMDGIRLTNDEALILARKKYTSFIKAYMMYAQSGGIVNV